MKTHTSRVLSVLSPLLAFTQHCPRRTGLTSLSRGIGNQRLLTQQNKDILALPVKPILNDVPVQQKARLSPLARMSCFLDPDSWLQTPGQSPADHTITS